mmetsp:Transcript_96825/g.312693  ORF Transcript_96825/g.312693 Transcript_96825/m.312693 type:complete len:210 (+) Transcript_96825:768-1397(+)
MTSHWSHEQLLASTAAQAVASSTDVELLPRSFQCVRTMSAALCLWLRTEIRRSTKSKGKLAKHAKNLSVARSDNVSFTWPRCGSFSFTDTSLNFTSNSLVMTRSGSKALAFWQSGQCRSTSSSSAPTSAGSHQRAKSLKLQKKVWFTMSMAPMPMILYPISTAKPGAGVGDTRLVSEATVESRAISEESAMSPLVGGAQAFALGSLHPA